MRRPFSDWTNPPADIAIEHHRVDLWRVQLDQPEATLSQLEPVLSPDERSRANRFHFARDRRRFVVARAHLRLILARYSAVASSELVFTYGSHGKPSLEGQPKAGLKFNLSHSGELALIGVTTNREIGVDIEQIRPIDDYIGLTERFFSSHENSALGQISESNRLEAFYCCWTLKEAYLKATGDGLGRDTRSFDVTFGGDGPTKLLRVDGEPLEPARWSLEGFAPAPGYIGAVAVENAESDLNFQTFDSNPC